MVRRTSKKTPAGQAASHAKDAVQTLKADHRKVRKLFDRFRTSSDSEKSDLARRLFAELDLHTKLEEELIYPALRAGVGEASFDRPSLGNGLDLDATGDSEDVGEDEINRLAAEPDDIRDQEERSEAAEALSSAYEHHEAMNDLMQQLRSIDPAAPDYSELLAELEDMFVEHVTEEEDVLLPIVSATLDVQALGFEMQRRKDDVGSQPPLAA